MKTFIIALLLLATAAATAAAAPSLLQGRVFDRKTGANISARVTVVNASTGATLVESRSNSASGNYAAVIIEGKSFTIKVIVECDGYPKTERTLKFVYTGEYQEIMLDVPLEVKKTVRKRGGKIIKP